MRRVYSLESIEYLRSIADGVPIEDIIKIFVAKYPEHIGLNYTRMRQLMVRNKIRNNLLHKYTGLEKRKLLTPEQEQFFIDNNYGKTAQEMSDLIYTTFGKRLTTKQVKSLRGRFKIDSGLTGYFEKGAVAWNKGKKCPITSPERLRTCFKKGNVPYNTLAIGAEIITKDGYTLVKVDNQTKVCKYKNWKLKHRLIWEAAHKQKVPDDCVIIFLDQNKQNFDVNNLMCVKKSEMSGLNGNHLWSTNGDINKTQVMLLRLKSAIKERGGCRTKKSKSQKEQKKTGKHLQ